MAGRRYAPYLAMAVLLALLCSAPAALAGDVRIATLGGLGWVIDDDLDNFLNPANAAWVEEGYLTACGELLKGEYSADSSFDATLGMVRFVQPAGMLAGRRNVVAGWASGGPQNSAAVGGKQTLAHYGFSLADALAVNDRLALGGSFTYFPAPNSMRIIDARGTVDVVDNGAQIGFEGGLTYRPSDQATVELGILRSSQDNTITVRQTGLLDVEKDFEYSSTMIQGKLGYALSDRTKVAVAVKSIRVHAQTGADPEVDETETRVTLGATHQLTDRLLLAGGYETENGGVDGGPSWERTFLRGGVEYRLSDSLTLRGGVIHSALESPPTYVDVTAGVGLSLGSGQLDFCALVYHTDSDDSSDYPKYSDLTVSYTAKF